jgi:hypothetical protein
MHPEAGTATGEDSPFVRFWAYIVSVGERWATVTVTDAGGKRHSVDVFASSTYDAAHLFVAHAKGNPRSGCPILGTETKFEVSVAGKIYYVQGSALRRWIIKERQARKGPAGFLFSKRPTLD